MSEVDPVVDALAGALARDTEVSAGTVLDVQLDTSCVVDGLLTVGVRGAQWRAGFGPGADLDRIAENWAQVQHAVGFDLARRRGAYAPWPGGTSVSRDRAVAVRRRSPSRDPPH